MAEDSAPSAAERAEARRLALIDLLLKLEAATGADFRAVIDDPRILSYLEQHFRLLLDAKVALSLRIADLRAHLQVNEHKATVNARSDRDYARDVELVKLDLETAELGVQSLDFEMAAGTGALVDAMRRGEEPPPDAVARAWADLGVWSLPPRLISGQKELRALLTAWGDAKGRLDAHLGQQAVELLYAAFDLDRKSDGVRGRAFGVKGFAIAQLTHGTIRNVTGSQLFRETLSRAIGKGRRPSGASSEFQFQMARNAYAEAIATPSALAESLYAEYMQSSGLKMFARYFGISFLALASMFVPGATEVTAWAGASQLGFLAQVGRSAVVSAGVFATAAGSEVVYDAASPSGRVDWAAAGKAGLTAAVFNQLFATAAAGDRAMAAIKAMRRLEAATQDAAAAAARDAGATSDVLPKVPPVGPQKPPLPKSTGGGRPVTPGGSTSAATPPGGGGAKPPTTPKPPTRPPKPTIEAGGAAAEEAGEGGASRAGTRSAHDRHAPKKPYSHLKDDPSVGPSKSFTRSQKRRILAENRKREGGVLRDDVTGEELVSPKQHQKGISPPNAEAQVDHVVPKAKGGWNSFENAEVRSRAGNIEKSDKMPEMPGDSK